MQTKPAAAEVVNLTGGPAQPQPSGDVVSTPLTSVSALHLGALRLLAPSSWRFYAFDKFVSARRQTRLGSLQITMGYADDAPHNASHDECLDVLSRFMTESLSGAAYAERVEQQHGTFGHITLHDAQAFGRYWYRHRNGRLVLAVYQCIASNFSAAQDEIAEAALIAASMEMGGVA